MPSKKEPDWNKIREKQALARTRAREKQQAKLSDPKWREEQYQKRKEQQKRQDERQIEKQKKKVKTKAKPAKPKKSSRGMKGRTPTALERRLMDKIGALPCVCCEQEGRINHQVSLHHTDGRTKALAHAKVLPLCAYHHDTPLSSEERLKYPSIIPFHAKGNVGGKTAFEAQYGTQEELLKRVYQKIDEDRPWLCLDTSEH